MEKFIEVKDATRHAHKHSEHRSSSVDARQTSRVRLTFLFFVEKINFDFVFSLKEIGQFNQVDQIHLYKLNLNKKMLILKQHLHKGNYLTMIYLIKSNINLVQIMQKNGKKNQKFYVIIMPN